MTLKETLKKNLNVPNVLSLIRLLLVPVYLILFVRGQKTAALIVFAAACFTDLLDGRIARKYNLITDLGKLLDPVADKVMILTAMFSMTIGNDAIHAVIPWAAVLVVLAKELMMIAGGALLLKHGIVVYSSMVGKVAHCLFIAGLLLSYFHEDFVRLCSGWPMTPDLIVIWAAVVCTLCALCFYVWKNVRQAKAMGVIGQKKEEGR